MNKIFIYDTTWREGSQGEGISFSLQDKLAITLKLDDLGVDYIEGGYPIANPKDESYFQEVKSLKLRHAKIAAVDSGVRQVQGTINGFGERCGNADLCSIIPNLVLKKGYHCLGDGGLKKLTEVS